MQLPEVRTRWTGFRALRKFLGVSIVNLSSDMGVSPQLLRYHEISGINYDFLSNAISKLVIFLEESPNSIDTIKTIATQNSELHKIKDINKDAILIICDWLSDINNVNKLLQLQDVNAPKDKISKIEKKALIKKMKMDILNKISDKKSEIKKELMQQEAKIKKRMAWATLEEIQKIYTEIDDLFSYTNKQAVTNCNQLKEINQGTNCNQLKETKQDEDCTNTDTRLNSNRDETSQVLETLSSEKSECKGQIMNTDEPQKEQKEINIQKIEKQPEQDDINMDNLANISGEELRKMFFGDAPVKKKKFKPIWVEQQIEKNNYRNKKYDNFAHNNYIKNNHKYNNQPKQKQQIDVNSIGFFQNRPKFKVEKKQNFEKIETSKIENSENVKKTLTLKKQ